MRSAASHEVEAKLRFADYDALGHVNSLRLAELVEDARMRFLEDVPQLPAHEWRLVKLELEYHGQPCIDLGLITRTWINEIGNSSVQLCHSITQTTEDVITARSVIVQTAKSEPVAARLESVQRTYLERFERTAMR